MHFLNGPGYEAKMDIADVACTMSYTIAHSAIQSVVYFQDLILKPLVAPLYALSSYLLRVY